MRHKKFDPDNARLKAMNLFWQKGYTACSMDELLSETGLSRSSFYNAFGNKRDLYLSILDHFAHLSLSAYQILHANKSMELALNELFQLIFFSPAVKLDHGCLLVNTLLEQQAHDIELANIASQKLFLLEQELMFFFERSQDSGQLKSKLQPAELAAYFMTVIKGLRVAAREGKSCSELKANIQISLSILKH